MQAGGADNFRYFTVDSNILAAVSSLFIIFHYIKGLFTSDAAPAKYTVLLRLMGTSAVTITLLTVLVFLGPTMGYGLMFSGWTLHMHLLTPLLSIISFCLLEDDAGHIGALESAVGVAPTALYGAIYLTMVVIIGHENGGWEDFYGFNRGGMWMISLAVMLAASYIISLSLAAVKNRLSRHGKDGVAG